jgi:DNA-binding LacI/PurR family transcriptional regulator
LSPRNDTSRAPARGEPSPQPPAEAGAGRRITAKHVAQAAGVSRTAVSFAFNDPARISAETRQRILDVAAQLGYAPDPVARMLVNGQTRTLGLLLPQDIPQVMQNPYYSQFLVGLGQVCHREGMSLLLAPPLRSSMLQAIPYAAADGFVVCGLEVDRGEVDELRRRKVPFVLVDSDAPDGVPSVEVTDREGMAGMVRHLLELGHRRLAILSFEGGPDREHYGYRGPLARRIAGIQDALSDVGMSLDHPDIRLVEVPCTKADGYRATSGLMSGPRRPTVIVALSDILAIGAIDALHDLGVSIPGEVSVTGFDDQPEAAWVRPRLTTVRQPIQAKGRVAGDFLISAIRSENQHPHQLLHTALIVRESTGPATT